MKLHDIAPTYTFEHFFDFGVDSSLFENDSQWTIRYSSNFKRGLKKHQNDKRVMQSVKEIMAHLQNGVHPMELPEQYNVHPIKSKANPWQGFYDAHVKGKKIILLFQWDKDDKRVDFAHIGTHQEAKLTRD